MKKYLSVILILIIFIVIPSTSFADGSVNFIGVPDISFSQNNSSQNWVLSYSGGLVLADVNNNGISNVSVSVGISASPILENYNGPFIQTFIGNTDPTISDIVCAASDCGFGGIYADPTFESGQIYYIILKIQSIHPNIAPFTGQTILLHIAVPPTATNDGEDTNPNSPSTATNDNTDCPNPNDNVICPPTTATPYNPDFTVGTLTNPLGVDFDILGFLQVLFVNFVKIALPFLVIFIIYSGFLFVEARGNEEKLVHAKKNFFYVIIGTLIVLGAWTIAHVLSGTVDQFSINNVLNHIINLV